MLPYYPNQDWSQDILDTVYSQRGLKKSSIWICFIINNVQKVMEYKIDEKKMLFPSDFSRFD